MTFLTNLSQKFSKKTLALGIAVATIFTLLAIGSLIYLQNQKANQKLVNLAKNQNSVANSAETECQKQNGRYLLGENGFGCIFVSVSNSQNSSQTSSYDYSAEALAKNLEKENLQKEEKAKIQELKAQFSQIDLVKNPKPWLLLGDELVDNNNQKIIQIPLESKVGNTWNNKWLKPILTKENKLYFPFWVGQIAVIDTETGKVTWQDLGFEIKDASLFDGKYFVMKKDNCVDFNSGDANLKYQQGNCPIFALDRGTLVEKKVYNPEVETMGCAGCCGLIRKIVFADSNFLYLSEICPYNGLEITKYRLDNNKFVETYRYDYGYCYEMCDPDKHYRISKISVDLYQPKYKNMSYEEIDKITKENSKILLERSIAGFDKPLQFLNH